MLIAVLVVYLPAVFNEFVEWDDALFIAKNPRFNPPTPATVFYYLRHTGFNLYMPVSYGFWTVLAKIGYVDTPDALGTRLNPYLFHMAGVLLHVLATGAVLAILRRAVGSPWAAAGGALLFALHPLQVESVAFIGTMNTPIAGALALVAIVFYLRAVAPDSSSPKGAYIAGTFFLLLALFSKPTAVVAPVLAGVLDLAIYHRSLRSTVRSILPWVLLVIPCIIWTKLIQSVLQHR